MKMKTKILMGMMILIMLGGSTNAHAKSNPKSFPKTIQGPLHEMICRGLEEYGRFLYDRNLLAEVMYHENWHTDKDHLAAYYTGAVVRNRVKSKNWPNTFHDVVYQKGQYAVVGELFTTEIPKECYDMATDILLHGTPDVPENVVYQATFKQGHGDWIPPINGEHFCYE